MQSSTSIGIHVLLLWVLVSLTGFPCTGGEVMTVLMGCIIGMMSLGRGAAFVLARSTDGLALLTSL